MSDQLKNLNLTFTARSAPQSGPSSSDAWNDSFTEMAVDLATIVNEWNNKLTIALNGLPEGTLDTSVNAWKNGLDGRTMWVDSSVVSTNDDLTYFNSPKNRPATIEEAFDTVYQYINNQITQLTTSVLDTATGLTTAQKNRIGANVFDSAATSSSASLDSKSENNRLNLIQLAYDMYGASYSLNNNGSPLLTNSLFSMVDALLELHGGNWSDDVTLNHSGAFSATQSDITSSTPGDDTYAGPYTTLEHDMDQFRALFKTTKGTASYTASLSSLYAGGPDSLEDLLTSTVGSGTKSATNPFGYAWGNVEGLPSVLTAIQTFTGQDDESDSTTTYSSTANIDNGDSLETAIGKLDAAITTGDASNHLLLDGSRPMVGTLNLAGQDVEHVEDLAVGGNVTASGNVTVDGDLEVTVSGVGLILKSDDGTRWRIGIDNSGALVSIAI